jgi:hypothetical protein
MVQRIRNKNQGVPLDPASLAELEIPQEFALYNDDENFVLADTGSEAMESRILVFGRDGNKAWSGQIKQIFVDGTFSVSFFRYITLISKKMQI